MRHIQGEDRSQGTLFPDRLEDFVAANHPIRVIDSYIDRLDFEGLGFSKATTKETGRKPYHPGDLLKLYVYGYLNRVKSSRRLETECHRNLEVIWLMKRLRPDFKTIADFRKDNGLAIRQTCRSFIQFCREAGLVPGQRVALDGSKFKAAASRDQMLTRKKLKRERAKIEAQIQRYLGQLDEADRGEALIDLDRDQVEEALTRLEAQSQHLDEREQAMDELGGDQHCATETEARLMPSGHDGMGMILGYNVQSAVETETGLIVHHDVSDHAGDGRLLQPMAEAVKAALKVDELEVLADAGYSNGEQQAACEAQGITATVPRRTNCSAFPDRYQKRDFKYDESSDSFTCPAGEILRYVRDDRRRMAHVYQRSGCDQCALQAQCTTADTRSITRNFNEAVFERSTARLKADRTLMTQRMAIAERPFAVLKQAMGLRRFSCRGIQSAKAEMAISVLTYNMNLMIRRLGVGRMMAMVGPA